MDALEFPTLQMDSIRPNNWNPNKLDKSSFQKLKNGISRIITESGTIPPITVRPLKEPEGVCVYEIIDGEHRYRAMDDLGYEEIPACILNVGESDARVLTITLNYLRGEADLYDYVSLIQEIVDEGEFKLEDIAEFVPQDSAALEDMLNVMDQNFDFSEIDAMVEESMQTAEVEKENSSTSASDDQERYVTIEVVVPLSIAESFQSELVRIKNHLMLSGIDNIESKSIEIMAKISAEKDLHEIDLGKVK